MKCVMFLAALVCAAAGQPLMCLDDAQCAHGTFCYQHQECRRCLQCAELQRAPRAVPANCTMSVVDCGPCLPGLVPDPSGNLEASCVAAPLGGADPPPPYLWITLGALAVLLATCLLALLYVVRHTDSVKILSNISLWLPCSQVRDASPTDAPPPYNAAHYSPVRPTSPPLDPLPTYQPHAPESVDNGYSMFPRESKAAMAARGPVLRDAAQEAVAYHHPRVRFPDQPHHDDDDGSEHLPPDLHDQDTAQSDWTPRDDTNNNTTNSGPLPSDPGSAAELSTLLREARDLTVIRPPDRQPVARQNATDRQAVVRQTAAERRTDADDATPSKLPCVRQDSEASASSAGQSSAQASLGINIYVQHNDVKIFK